MERFSDYMVKDVKKGDCYRADHLIKGHIEKMLTDKKLAADKKSAIMDILARVPPSSLNPFPQPWESCWPIAAGRL